MWQTGREGTWGILPVGRYGRIYAVQDSPMTDEEVAGGEEVAGVRVLHCRWHLYIVSFPLACRDMTALWNGTRPHVGLHD